jgi:hypothetical protein
VLPLDAAAVRDGCVVAMHDFEVETAMLLDMLDVSYRWRTRWNRDGGGDVELRDGEARAPVVNLSESIAAARAAGGAEFEADPFLTLRFEREDREGAVEAHVRVIGEREVMLVALERD